MNPKSIFFSPLLLQPPSTQSQPLATISNHLRRRVCCRRHAGNAPNNALRQQPAHVRHNSSRCTRKLLLALPAVRAGCCTRACASCCTHSVRCWLREQHALAAGLQHALAGSKCCWPRAACSVAVRTAAAVCAVRAGAAACAVRAGAAACAVCATGSMCCWPRAACCWLLLSKFSASIALICHP